MPLAAERETLRVERGRCLRPLPGGSAGLPGPARVHDSGQRPAPGGRPAGQEAADGQAPGAAIDDQGRPTSRGSRLCSMAALSALPKESGLTFGALDQLQDVTGRHPLPSPERAGRGEPRSGGQGLRGEDAPHSLRVALEGREAFRREMETLPALAGGGPGLRAGKRWSPDGDRDLWRPWGGFRR